MDDHLVTQQADGAAPGRPMSTVRHGLVKVEAALHGEAIGTAGPQLDAATSRFLVGGWPIDALDERVGVEQLFQGLRLAGMVRDALDADTHHEGEFGGVRVGHA